MKDSRKVEVQAELVLHELEQRTRLVDEASKSVVGIKFILSVFLGFGGVYFLVIFFFESLMEIFNEMLPVIFFLIVLISSLGYGLDRRINALVKILEVEKLKNKLNDN